MGLYAIPADDSVFVQAITYFNVVLTALLFTTFVRQLRSPRNHPEANRDRVRDALQLAAVTVSVAECSNTIALLSQATFPRVDLWPFYSAVRAFAFLPVTGISQLMVTQRVKLVSVNVERRRRIVWRFSVVWALITVTISVAATFVSFAESERTGLWDAVDPVYAWIPFLTLAFPTFSAYKTGVTLVRSLCGLRVIIQPLPAPSKRAPPGEGDLVKKSVARRKSARSAAQISEQAALEVEVSTREKTTGGVSDAGPTNLQSEGSSRGGQVTEISRDVSPRHNGKWPESAQAEASISKGPPAPSLPSTAAVPTTTSVPLQIELNSTFKWLSLAHIMCWLSLVILAIAGGPLSILLRFRVQHMIIIVQDYVEIQFKIRVRARLPASATTKKDSVTASSASAGKMESSSTKA